MKKTNLFAIFVAVLVAGTYYFEFYKSQKDEQIKAETNKIVRFVPEQINRFEVENAKGKVVLVRNQDGWSITEPIEDWADPQYAEDFVNGLATEVSKENAAEGEAISWPVYGFDKDFNKVTFLNQKGESQRISVSEKKNFEGNSFLRRESENKVLIGTSQWLMRSQSGVLEFRDKRLFRGKTGSVEEMSIKNQKDHLRLALKNTKWVSLDKPDIKLDQNKVREILSSLNEMQAADFLKSLPDAKEMASLNLKLKDKTWSATLRQGKDKSVYAEVKDPAFNLQMQPGQADRFFDMTLMSLRDRREPFDFQNLMIEEITIESEAKKWTLVKDGSKNPEAWKVAGDEKLKVNEKAVRTFITRLSDTAVTEYLEKSEQSLFKSPDQKMALYGKDKKVLFVLEWGNTYKKKIAVGEKDLVLARSNLFKDAFGLDPSVIESWGLASLVPKEAP